MKLHKIFLDYKLEENTIGEPKQIIDEDYINKRINIDYSTKITKEDIYLSIYKKIKLTINNDLFLLSEKLEQIFITMSIKEPNIDKAVDYVTTMGIVENDELGDMIKETNDEFAKNIETKIKNFLHFLTIEIKNMRIDNLLNIDDLK